MKNSRNLARRSALAAGVLAALFALRPAEGYIEALYPLKQVLDETEVIVEGVIEKADAQKKIFIVKCGKVLKGKNAYEKININVGVGQEWHPDAVMPHAVVGIPTLVFYNQERKAIMYMNKFFIQLYGDPAMEPAKAWWSLTHVEIRMNRTFNGTAPELSKLVSSVLAGKTKPPAPNPSIPPLTKATVAKMPKATATGEPGPTPTPDPKAAHAAYKTSDEGFIRHWLLLGPIALGDKAGDHSEGSQKPFFDKDWFPRQKDARPKEEEKVKVGETQFAWEANEASEYYVDLGATENSMMIGVAYLWCEKEIPSLTLAIGSDDSSLWRLNGQEVIRVYAGRGVEKDQDKSKPVTLKAGLNVLMMSVINGGGPTAGCARFLDKDGNPVTGILVSHSPTPNVEKKK